MATISFFHGNKFVTGVSAREVADLLVPRRCVRAGAGSGPTSCEMYNHLDLLVLRPCVRVGVGSCPNLPSSLDSLSNSISESLLVK